MYGAPGTPRSYVPSSLPSCPIFGNSSRRAIVCKIFSTTSRADCGLSFPIHAASASISAMAASSMITLIRHDGVNVFGLQQATQTFDRDLLFGGALPQAARPLGGRRRHHVMQNRGSHARSFLAALLATRARLRWLLSSYSSWCRL